MASAWKAALVSALVVLGLAAPAAAGTATVRDEGGKPQQGPANSLVRATITYSESRTVMTARLKDVDRRFTQVFATVSYPDSSFVRLRTYYRNGRERIVRGDFVNSAGGRQRVHGVSTRWDGRTNRVTLVLNNVVGDPKPWNKRAALGVYTVRKGQFHGPLCPLHPVTGMPERCNDDAVFVRLRR